MEAEVYSALDSERFMNHAENGSYTALTTVRFELTRKSQRAGLNPAVTASVWLQNQRLALGRGSSHQADRDWQSHN
jgi:hypothetical protein